MLLFQKWWHHSFNSHLPIVFAALIELVLVSKQGNIITLTPNLLQKHNCCWQVWSSKISSWWQTEWIEKKMATPDNASNKGRGMLGEHSNGSPNQKGKLIRVISNQCITTLFSLPNYSYKLNCTTICRSSPATLNMIGVMMHRKGHCNMVMKQT